MCTENFPVFAYPFAAYQRSEYRGTNNAHSSTTIYNNYFQEFLHLNKNILKGFKTLCNHLRKNQWWRDWKHTDTYLAATKPISYWIKKSNWLLKDIDIILNVNSSQNAHYPGELTLLGQIHLFQDSMKR